MNPKDRPAVYQKGWQDEVETRLRLERYARYAQLIVLMTDSQSIAALQYMVDDPTQPPQMIETAKAALECLNAFEIKLKRLG